MGRINDRNEIKLFEKRIGSDLITIGDIVTWLNITERQIRNMIYQKNIPYKKIGRLIRFEKREIDKWLLERSF